MAKENQKQSFIIAEIGVNHNGDLELAFELINNARNAGANAVKFQSFSATRLSSPETPKVAYQKLRDLNRSHFEMLQSLELSFDEQRKLFDYANSIGIEFLSTPYSIIDAEFLFDLGVKKFKTASADISDVPLQSYISSLGIETLVSTGMASLEEIDFISSLYSKLKTPLILMHTTSEYPTPISNANMSRLTTLQKFEVKSIGFSDHTLDSTCAIMAIGMGCEYFEKHFTLDRQSVGPDHAASLDPIQFTNFVRDIRNAEEALGNTSFKRSLAEEDMAATSRKSLHFGSNLDKGDLLRESHLILMRPGDGLEWSQRNTVLNKRLGKKVNLGDKVFPDMFD